MPQCSIGAGSRAGQTSHVPPAQAGPVGSVSSLSDTEAALGAACGVYGAASFVPFVDIPAIPGAAVSCATLGFVAGLQYFFGV
jgi:hypothetical protein